MRKGLFASTVVLFACVAVVFAWGAMYQAASAESFTFEPPTYTGSPAEVDLPDAIVVTVHTRKGKKGCNSRPCIKTYGTGFRAGGTTGCKPCPA
jgi:hypothetical protein